MPNQGIEKPPAPPAEAEEEKRQRRGKDVKELMTEAGELAAEPETLPPLEPLEPRPQKPVSAEEGPVEPEVLPPIEPKERPEIRKEGFEIKGVLPEAVRPTLTETAKGIFSSLKERTQRTVAKLFEKVVSSDIVQNVVERHRIQVNARKAALETTKLESLTKSQEQEKQVEQDLRKAAEKVQQELAQLEKTLGRELTEKEKGSAAAEWLKLTQNAEASESKISAMEKQMKDVKQEAERYEQQIAISRGRLAGRLNEKVKANEVEIGARKEGLKEFEIALTHYQRESERLAQIDSNLKESLKGMVSQSTRSIAEAEIKKIARSQKEFAKYRQLHLKKIKTLQEEIDNLEKKNVDLKDKRDKILPPEEKPAVKEKQKAEPMDTSARVRSIILYFGGGLEKKMTSEGLTEIDAEGNVFRTPFNKIPLGTVHQFIKALEGKDLREIGVQEAIIDVLEEGAKREVEERPTPEAEAPAEGIEEEAAEKRERDPITYKMEDQIKGWNRWSKMTGLEGWQISLTEEDKRKVFSDRTKAADFLAGKIYHAIKGKKVSLKQVMIEVKKYFAI